ncbi:hypothetical protein ACFOU2_23040 [Bacillus songklensis]|uniref:Uncharacterized protein n=1 Tax=Bacillus songklensis TaxID=1069116 RepID=A0ABV8B8V0_9BACI
MDKQLKPTIFSLAYELIFIMIYFLNILPRMNSLIATLYWLSAGSVGVITGLMVVFNQKLEKLPLYLAIVTGGIGFVLLAMLYMAIMVTSR